jgi:NADH kinase
MNRISSIQSINSFVRGQIRHLRIVPPHEPREMEMQTPKDAKIKFQMSPHPNQTSDYTMKWIETPLRVLVLKKPNDVATSRALVQICKWMGMEYPQVTLMIEPSAQRELGEDFSNVNVVSTHEASNVTDAVITLGGDGTMLHASTLFRETVPPILSFSMGTVGFLMSWHIQHFKHAIRTLLNPEERNISLMMRMRLAVSLHNVNGARLEVTKPAGRTDNYSPHVDSSGGTIQTLNELTLHRGRQPHLTSLDLFVNDEPLTTVVADGCIVATPTGSTAYSLSAGGPILHPSVQSMLCTPICPRSLSFRPIVLPPHSMLKIRLAEDSRGLAEVGVDGRDYHVLEKGQFVAITQSLFPVPCINRMPGGVGWTKDIRETLKFNTSFENNVLQQHLETGWDLHSVRPIAVAQGREVEREISYTKNT